MKNRLVIKVGYWFDSTSKDPFKSFECLAEYWRWEEERMLDGDKLDIALSFRVSTCIRVTYVMDSDGTISCRDMVAKVQPKGSGFGPFREPLQHDSPILIAITEAAKKLEKLGFQKAN